MVRDRWFVELLLDSGQRIASIDMTLADACLEADDFASRMCVVLVTAVHAETGEAFVMLGTAFRAALDSRAASRTRGLRRLLELSVR